MIPSIRAETVTILSGQALSGPIWIGGAALTGIRMPAAWDAANLTFQVASTAAFADALNVFDATGAEVSAVAAASRLVALSPLGMRGLQWLRIRSGTSATPVNQTANRALIVVFGGAA